MKLKIGKFKVNKSVIYKILFLLIIVVVSILTARYLLKQAMYANRSKSIDFAEESIDSKVPLEMELKFNNEIEKMGPIEDFISYIDSAEYSVEIAVFSLKSQRLYDAILNADKRGVKVTMILDSSRKAHHDYDMGVLPKSIVRIDAGNYESLDSKNNVYMHHKYMIVDRGYPTQKLIAGSLNFTDVGEKYNQSFYFITSDQNLVSVYGEEFDLLNRRSGVSKIGDRSYDPWSARIQYANSFVEVWMSPGFSKRSLKYRILDLIENATSSLDLMMWDFTDEDIAQALIKKGKEGLKVRLLVENTTTENIHSVVSYMSFKKEKEGLQNLEIILDDKSEEFVKEIVPYGFNPYLHQHTMIVDKNVVVFGTNNWSLWGFYQNDEDSIVTDDKYAVEEFQKTFDYFYKVLK